jgi:hypothetical protein
MKLDYSKLLRRTLAVLGAGTMLAATLPTAAQTVTLSGATGNTCNYSQMTVQPNGTITVTCTGAVVTPPPPVEGQANFTVDAPKLTGEAWTLSEAYIHRTGGPGGPLTVQFTYSGTGCAVGSYSGTVALTDGAQQLISFMLSAGGPCTVAISPPTGHTASTNSVTITVPTAGTPPVSGCPTPEVTALNRTLDYGPVDQLRMKSGIIATYPVIASPDGRYISVEFTQGQQPNTPGGATTEFSVSQCKGVISTSVPDCYYKSNQGSVNSNKITIYTKTKPEWGWVDQSSLSGYGCLADLSKGAWYVNVRWTYAICNYGENCGFSMQWALGAW